MNASTYLNSWFSLMTCIPRRYCSFVGFSPIFAKWPLTDIIDGAVGCRVLVEGRRSEVEVEEAMTQTRNTSSANTSYNGSRLGFNGQLKMLVMWQRDISLCKSWKCDSVIP